METPLTTILQNYSGNHYQDLFIPGAILKTHPKSGKWIISRERIPKKNEKSFHDALISSLSKENLTSIPNAEKLIYRINRVFQDSIPIQNPPKEILFKSSSKAFAFLSNFFPTLIVYNGNLFRSSEHLYQWKVATYLEPAKENKHYKAIRDIIDPLKARNYSHTIQHQHDPVNAHIKEEIMRDIIRLKFEQNPHLYAALKEVQKCTLKEDTESQLWGGENNLMGRILTDLAQTLFANK